MQKAPSCEGPQLLQRLEELKQQKLVRCQRHPTAPRTIWNYTDKCQYSRENWDDVTLSARGLILDDQGRVIARGFRKFFNYGERPDPLPDEPFKVLDKLDGSMAVLSFVNGEPEVATRGSFDGPQAVRATKMFRERYSGYRPPEGTTAVFEIIYPENRIVVDYGDTEDLYHLGLVDNETGLVFFDLDPDWPGPSVQEFPNAAPEELSSRLRDNAEGFVVRYRNGYQVKVKLAEYLRVHRAMFSTSTRSIWEYLSAGKDVADLIYGIPDEVMPFIREHSMALLSKFAYIDQQAKEYFAAIQRYSHTRKLFAEQAKKFILPSVLFAMLDQKPYTGIIWKHLEPEWVPAKAPPSEDVA